MRKKRKKMRNRENIKERNEVEEGYWRGGIEKGVKRSTVGLGQGGIKGEV